MGGVSHMGTISTEKYRLSQQRYLAGRYFKDKSVCFLNTYLLIQPSYLAARRLIYSLILCVSQGSTKTF